MSVRIMTMIWDSQFPTQTAKLVALKLADCANDDGENVYPSVSRVERETGCSESAVREALALLEREGFLHVVEEGSPVRYGRSTVIRRFDLEKLGRLARNELEWVHEVHQPIDAASGLPKVRADGRPRVERLWKTVPAGTATPPGTGGVPLLAPEGTPPGTGPHPSGQPKSPCTPYKDNRQENRHSHTGRAREVDEIVEKLVAGGEGRGEIVRDLIEPILRQRSFSAPDELYALGQLCDRDDVRGLDAAGRAKAVGIVLERRAATVKPHDVQVAVGEVATALRLERHTRESSRKAEPEAGLVTRRIEFGSPEWDTQIAWWRRNQPAMAKRFEAQGFMICKGPSLDASAPQAGKPATALSLPQAGKPATALSLPQAGKPATAFGSPQAGEALA